MILPCCDTARQQVCVCVWVGEWVGGVRVCVHACMRVCAHVHVCTSASMCVC